MNNRQIHDAAHPIAVGILHLLAPDLSEEVQASFYRNVMPIIVNGIADYDRRKGMEESRLKVRIPNDLCDVKQPEAMNGELSPCVSPSSKQRSDSA